MDFRSSGRTRARICEEVPTADGTVLSADVYLPPDPGSYPTLVTLTPYDNNRSPRVQGGATPIPAKADLFRALADSGYVVAAIDVRGRGDSEGEFVPFAHEAADGADVIRWVRALEECNGRVGVFGSGYAGFAGLAAAAGGGVDAVSAVSPFGLGAAGLLAPGGAVRLEWLFWMHLVGGRTVQSLHAPRWLDVFDHLPITKMHEALGREDIWWSDWLAHLDPEDELWSPLRDVYGRLGSLPVPLLLVTGWWDTSQPATFEYWKSAAGAEGGDRELLVGPWDTAAARSPTRHVGGVDFGSGASVDLPDLLLDWFDRKLGSEPTSAGSSRARVFVTGADRWASLTAWPPETESRSLWLSSDGRANTRAGDGWLFHEVPSDGQRPDAYTYDPARPVVWQPGFASFSRENAPLLLDESHLTTRDDVLVYTSEPASEAWTVAGTCRLVLFAETDTPDTDWIATLSDVFPHDGNAVHLTHAAVRAASSPGFTPGTATKFTLTFADVAHEFLPGHAVRLTVTSSLFPLYARNPNDPDYLGAAETRIAQQRIHHDDDHPSCLQLPVVGRPLVPPRGARTDWFE